MSLPCSSRCFDVEGEAKLTLAHFSNCDFSHTEWANEPKLTDNERRKSVRVREPTRNLKPSAECRRKEPKSEDITPNSSFGGLPLLIPSKVSLESAAARKGQKLSQLRSKIHVLIKENCKPQKSVRGSPLSAAKQRGRTEGFDLMQYWVRHRFEDGAVGCLVGKLRGKRRSTGIRF